MSATERLLLGVDLGGTKIECAALQRDGRILARLREATPQGDYAGTLRSIAALLDALQRELPATRGLPLGVAIPGSVSPQTGLIRNANSTVLNGRDLRRDLQALLGRDVRLRNDANCLAASEAAADGAAAHAPVVFAAILGTGVGAGIAVRGEVLEGINGVAGEWGHNPLPWARGQAWGEQLARRCWCGRDGCNELWLSGPALAADAVAAGMRAGTTAQAVVEAMRAGDPTARACFMRWCDRLARGLAQVINVLDPDCIVLGGGLSNIPEVYTEVPLRWGAWVFSDVVRTRLTPARHGDSSGVRGAAWLWASRKTGKVVP